MQQLLHSSELRLHTEQYTNSKKESLMALVGAAAHTHTHTLTLSLSLSFFLSFFLLQDMTRLKLDDQTIANSKLSRYTSSTVSSTFLTISST